MYPGELITVRFKLKNCLFLINQYMKTGNEIIHYIICNDNTFGSFNTINIDNKAILK